ncbi:MAG: exodeoxyribonuclease VII large subunit, partial [Alistipes sp.]|nr:exodeoxyribonuclease VII large subunit [Alistipes sp.]
MTPNQPITLSDLQGAVKTTLLERFALPVWVVAEVAELKVNYSGHCYLELVEKGAKDGVPKAQARAVIWRSHYPRIAGYFEAETGQRLGAGLQVLIKATVNYHELYGFSLQISDIDPSYTLGDMARQRQQTIARLQAEGVWEMNREQVMPPVVQRIAVVSSRNAAGWQDFRNELQKSPYAFQVTLFDAFMQGEAAEDSIVAALYAISERIEEFDAVGVLRGGGSASDLNCFNGYRLCAHIAQFPLPILTGIGHDRDQSVADMVAHTALKTPTAVAAWFVERMGRIDRWLEDAARLINERTKQLLQGETLRLERAQSRLHRESREGLIEARMRLERGATRLPDAVQRFLERHRQQLQQAASIVESRHPKQILQLGFAVVRAEGRALRTVEELQRQRQISIELADGSVEIQKAKFKI